MESRNEDRRGEGEKKGAIPLSSSAMRTDEDEEKQGPEFVLSAQAYLGRGARRGGASSDAARGERRGQACGASKAEGHREGSEARGEGGTADG